MGIFSRFWRWLLSFFWSKELQVTIIGLPNVGKSTLVRAFSGGDTEESLSPTIGAKASETTKGGVTFKLFDIGGHQMYQSLWGVYGKNSNVIIYVIDSSDHESIQACNDQIESLLENDEIRHIPIIIIANKQDLPEAMKASEISEKMRLQQVDDRQIQLFCASARTKFKIDEIIEWMVDNL